MLKLISLLLLVASSAALNPIQAHLPIEAQFASAVKNGDAKTVAEILENYKIDVNLPIDGKTHLTRAAINSLARTHSFTDWFYDNPYVDIIRTLVKHGANPCILTSEWSYFDGHWHEYGTTMDLYLHYAYGGPGTPRTDIIRLIQCSSRIV